MADFYSMTPAEMWNEWKSQRATVGDVLQYQRNHGGTFSENGTWKKNGGRVE